MNLLTKLREFKKEELKPKPLINGNDLLAIGFSPGPIIKEILGEVYDLQLEGKFASRESALEWVKLHYVPGKKLQMKLNKERP